jgi:hypothetical protein
MRSLRLLCGSGGCSALPYCSANLVAEVLKQDRLAAEFNRVPCL